MNSEDNAFGVGYVIKAIAEDIRAMRSDMSQYALKTETAYLAAKIEEFVPRQELVTRIKHDDERYAELQRIATEIRTFIENAATKDDLKSLKLEVREQFSQGPIAAWVWPLTSFLVAVAALLYSIYRPGAH